MLSLFPDIYWLALVICACGRFIAAQIISYKLKKIYLSGRKELLADTVVKPQYRLFMRISGITHLLLVAGVVAMFYMVYEYVVPITWYSSYALWVVTAIGYMTLFAEFTTAVLAVVAIRKMLSIKY